MLTELLLMLLSPPLKKITPFLRKSSHICLGTDNSFETQDHDFDLYVFSNF